MQPNSQAVEVLRRAFDGVDAAFLALGTSPQQVSLEKGLVDAAASARVAQLVRLSVLGADPNGDYEVARRHGELDAYVVASGVPHTLLRAAYFDSNLLNAVASIATSDRWFGAIPDGRVAMIDPQDVSAVAAAVISEPARQNAVYELTGPAALTLQEVARIFSAVLGRPISYAAVDAATLRQGYASRGVPDWLTDMAVGIDVAMQAGRHAKVTQDFQQLTSASPRRVEDFVRDYRAAFAPAAAPVS